MKHHFPGLLKDKTAAGTIRWRVRVEGDRNRKIRIPMGPGEPGFDEHYHAARFGETIEILKPKRAATRSFDELCDRYIDWLEGQVEHGKYSKQTLDGRRRGLRQACDVRDDLGDRIGVLDADLPREAFVHIVDTFGGRTGAADTCLKALRAAYTWGEDRGCPVNSPVFRVSSGHVPGKGATPWTPSDVEAFLDRHGPGTMARLWFCLAETTAGRIGDMTWLGPKDEQVLDGVVYVDWQPGKSGSKPVCVPRREMLEIELENHEMQARDTYLVTEHGKPFASSGSLDNRVREWIKQAGLTDAEGKSTRSQHGIRKGVARLLAQSGASIYEIMAYLGHSEPKTTAIYTADFDRRNLAMKAFQKWDAASKEQCGPQTTERGPHSASGANKTRVLGEQWQPVGLPSYCLPPSRAVQDHIY